MGRVADRLRVLDSRIVSSRPYQPAIGWEAKALARLGGIGLACAACAAFLWPNHRLLSVAAGVAGYVAFYPWLCDQVLRRSDHPHVRRCLWVVRLPILLLILPIEWPMRHWRDRSFEGALLPGETLMTVEREDMGFWLVSNKAVYIWPSAHPDPDKRQDGHRLPFTYLSGVTEEATDDPTTVRRVLHVWPQAVDVDEPTAYPGTFRRTRGRSELVDLIRAGILAAEPGGADDLADEW